MTLPADQVKRETIKGYIQEAVKNMREQDLLKLRMKEIKEAVKESELIDPTDFSSAVQAAYDSQRHQEKIDALQVGIDIVDTLGGVNE